MRPSRHTWSYALVTSTSRNAVVICRCRSKLQILSLAVLVVLPSASSENAKLPSELLDSLVILLMTGSKVIVLRNIAFFFHFASIMTSAYLHLSKHGINCHRNLCK